MKVCILTEGGKQTGLGHITRCTSIYEAFEEKAIVPKFVVNGDTTIEDLLKGIEYEVFNWPRKEERLFGLMQDAAIVIIDSYLAETDCYKKISEIVKVPVYIDDNKRLDYPRGIVLNGSIYAEEMRYPRKEGVSYLLGIKYIPLRKDFREVPEKHICDNIKIIMITFGGADTHNITPKVLTLLISTYPEFLKKVIIAKGFQNISGIEKLKDRNTELIYHPDTAKMKEIMLESDIAISAGGQTLYELARIGVPTIAICTAENQLQNIKGWEKAGFIQYAGQVEEPHVCENILACIEEMKDRNLRTHRSLSGKKLIDGKGSKRALDIFFDRLGF